MRLPDDWDWKRPDYAAVMALRATRLASMRAKAGDGKEEASAFWFKIKQFYRENPVDFISDWAVTFDPRNADIGLPTVIPMVLFPKQEEAVKWIVDRWRNREPGVIEKSRDMGASWVACAVAVWVYLFHPGTVVGFGSRKEEYVDDAKDMKAIFPKIRMLLRFLPKELRPIGYAEKVDATYMTIANPENGSQIVGEAGDNIGRGGRATLYFVDEHAFIERAQRVDNALSQTTNCQIDISTPQGMDNPFAIKRFSGKRKVFTMHWRDHPAKDAAWYQRQVDKSDDPTQVAQELDIDYSASRSDVWIEPDLVEHAVKLDSSTIKPTGPVYVGLDVARFGKNESVLTIRQGRVMFPQHTWRNKDSLSLFGVVREVIDALPTQPAQIAVDVIGVGAGVYDLLKAHYEPQIQVIGVNSSDKVDDGVNFNRRARMWSACKQWFKDGPVSIPNDRKLQVQLSSPGHFYRGNKRLIESKDEMLKRGVESPDRADSLVLTFDTPAAENDLDMSFLEEGNEYAS